ncbi:MAG: transposase [Candidatus Paracaedibacteraceae bacterium]|nr:transposase [Candidatus Paracaedibacteraceae bacterium]
MSQKYNKDFKISAVKLYLQSGKSIESIAQDLGVSRASLGKWVTQYKREGDKSFPGSGHVVDEELRALKRELQLVKQERDILKKAVAIFSALPGKGTNS